MADEDIPVFPLLHTRLSGPQWGSDDVAQRIWQDVEMDCDKNTILFAIDGIVEGDVLGAHDELVVVKRSDVPHLHEEEQ